VESFHIFGNRFNGFDSENSETVETVFCCRCLCNIGLKPGVNETTFDETTFEAKPPAAVSRWVWSRKPEDIVDRSVNAVQLANYARQASQKGGHAAAAVSISNVGAGESN